MKVLKAHEFTRKAVGSRVHDWNTLLDGQIREIGADDMGDSKPSTFGGQFRLQAAKRNLSAHIQATEDGKGLIVQAVPASKEQIAEWEAKRAQNGKASPAPKGKKGK